MNPDTVNGRPAAGAAGTQKVSADGGEALVAPAGSVRFPRRLVSDLTFTAARLAILVAFLVLWELASRRGWIDPLLIGSPTKVFQAFGSYFGSTRAWTAFGDTAIAVVLAFVIGSAAGIGFGLLLGVSNVAERLLAPFLAPLNSIPRIALAPLFIVWFGLTTTAKVALGVSIVFFVAAENARAASRGVETELLVMGRVAGLSRASLIMKVIVPSAVPSIFAAERLAWVFALLGVIASEMIAAPTGVGQEIVYFSQSLQVNTVFAILIVLMAVSVVVNALFGLVERRLLRWRPPQA